MSSNRVRFFTVEVDHLEHAVLLRRLREALSAPSQTLVATVNPEILLAARVQPDVARILRRMTWRIPDGVGIEMMARVLYGCHITRHPGSDLFVELCRCAADAGARVVVIGGWGTVSERALAVLRAAFPSLDIVGISDVAIRWDGDAWDQPVDLLERVRMLEPKIVALALGSARCDKQERWIVEHASQIPSARIVIGIGGTLDMVSGRTPRAPIWMQRTGVEWMWRLLLEPRRLARIWRAVILFPVYAVLDRMHVK